MRRPLLALALLAACRSAAPAPTPVPEAPDAPLRGDPAAAAALPPADRDAIHAAVLRFFRPTGRQARWIDPRPLAPVRGAETDSAAAPDAAWALAVRESAGSARVCVLDDEGAPCRGRSGGVLRLSRAYAAGDGEARVFVRYAPARESDGEVVRAPGPAIESLFTLARDGGRWRIVDHRPVRTP